MLYDGVSQTIDKLSKQYLAPAGVLIHHFKPQDKAERIEATPEIKLGWAAFHPVALSIAAEEIPQDKPYPHVVGLTLLGLEVINQLRAVQGDISLEEQRIINRERWEAAFRPDQP